VWMATLEQPIEILGPPELRDAARGLVGRLAAAVPVPAGDSDPAAPDRGR